MTLSNELKVLKKIKDLQGSKDYLLQKQSQNAILHSDFLTTLNNEDDGKKQQPTVSTSATVVPMSTSALSPITKPMIDDGTVCKEHVTDASKFHSRRNAVQTDVLNENMETL